MYKTYGCQWKRPLQIFFFSFLLHKFPVDSIIICMHYRVITVEVYIHHHTVDLLHPFYPPSPAKYFSFNDLCCSLREAYDSKAKMTLVRNNLGNEWVHDKVSRSTLFHPGNRPLSPCFPSIIAFLSSFFFSPYSLLSTSLSLFVCLKIQKWDAHREMYLHIIWIEK